MTAHLHTRLDDLSFHRAGWTKVCPSNPSIPTSPTHTHAHWCFMEDGNHRNGEKSERTKRKIQELR
jgi:hypothetical protein